MPTSPPNHMKFYFAQYYYPHHGTNRGGFFLTKYDAADFIIGYLSAGMEEHELPGEDDILGMHDKCDLYCLPDKTIASGEIGRVSFHILEIEPGDHIDLK